VIYQSSGTESVDQVQNRSHDATAVAEASSTAAKVFIHNTELGFGPLTMQTTAEQSPWWTQHQSAESAFTPTAYTDGTQVASMDDSAWQARSGWDVPGSTSTGNAAALIDKILLNNIDSGMSSPTVHYRDAFWTGTPDDYGNIYYQSNALHGIELEYDEVENRTDR
jgi:hypothetical protein